jgi:hypothetical protein
MAEFDPAPVPNLDPLVNSHQANGVEQDLQALFAELFDPDLSDPKWTGPMESLRQKERELNVYGMAQLGPFELVQRIVNLDGLALYSQTDTAAMTYLFKAWRSRNPKRGLLFLKTYLQLLFPNAWTCDQLWQKKSVPYPLGLYTRADISDSDPTVNYYLTSRVRVFVGESVDSGEALARVAPALRSVLAARLFLIAALERDFEDEDILGDGASGVTVYRYRDSSAPPA